MFSLEEVVITYVLIGFVCMLFLYPYIVNTYISTIEYNSSDSNRYNNQKSSKFSKQNVISYLLVPIVFALLWPIALLYVLANRV
jgi:uncharacterized membrane protein